MGLEDQWEQYIVQYKNILYNIKFNFAAMSVHSWRNTDSLWANGRTDTLGTDILAFRIVSAMQF
jgi:hypothetical protein